MPPCIGATAKGPDMDREQKLFLLIESIIAAIGILCLVYAMSADDVTLAKAGAEKARAA